MEDLFDDFRLLEEVAIEYDCLCSFEDMQIKLATLSLEDLETILVEDKQIEAVCPWCSTKYNFDEQDIKDIIEFKKEA